MTQEPTALNGVAPVHNVAKLTALIERLKNRGYGLPGFGVFYGPAGFGKTMAATYGTIKYSAVCVQAMSCSNPTTVCRAILTELGIKAEHGTANMVEQIRRALAYNDVPLIIDEVDHLASRKKIEILRDTYEGSQVPVILIGEELLPQKLRAWERVHSRVLDWVAADPATAADVRHLLPYYAPGIDVSAELQAQLLRGSGGSLRRICVNLQAVKELAAREGLSRVDIEHWGQRSFFDGQAPTPRRGIG